MAWRKCFEIMLQHFYPQIMYFIQDDSHQLMTTLHKAYKYKLKRNLACHIFNFFCYLQILSTSRQLLIRLVVRCRREDHFLQNTCREAAGRPWQKRTSFQKTRGKKTNPKVIFSSSSIFYSWGKVESDSKSLHLSKSLHQSKSL